MPPVSPSALSPWVLPAVSDVPVAEWPASCGERLTEKLSCPWLLEAPVLWPVGFAKLADADKFG